MRSAQLPKQRRRGTALWTAQASRGKVGERRKHCAATQPLNAVRRKRTAARTAKKLNSHVAVNEAWQVLHTMELRIRCGLLAAAST